ncbi:septum site-determining protein Ssd [Streptomyces sp. BI20]|uniref:septum site-determining protein Ssd n=1 Tax=Streptomyces sp. BI20 TaxID=3403460 RepID=UPI003C77A0B7
MRRSKSNVNGRAAEFAGAGPAAPTAGPLILTRDPALVEDLARLCAVAGPEPRIAGGDRDGPPGDPGGAEGPAAWRDAPLVLAGPDAADRYPRRPRRQGVLMVAPAPVDAAEEADLWRRAVAIGAEDVLFLPAAEARLLDRLADLADGPGRPALTVGVLAGSGGAGASTLGAALALAAARDRAPSTLIDADPLGGGLGALLGRDPAPGLRWPEIAGVRGRIDSRALAEALPAQRGVRCLTWEGPERRPPIRPDTMGAVLDAARRRGGCVVVDLPRAPDGPVLAALDHLDLLLLVADAESRRITAAHRTAQPLRDRVTDLRAVVRDRGRAGPAPSAVAATLGLPLAGELPEDPGRRERPGFRRGDPLARFSTALWARLRGPREPEEVRAA